MLKITDLIFSLKTEELKQEIKIIDKLSLRIEQGTFISIIGPSGCGKSTFLHLLSNLYDDYKGEIFFDGHCPKYTINKNELSIVFQKNQLFPWKTIEENIIFPLQLAKEEIDLKYVEQILHDFELIKFKNMYPHEISGGMIARCILARALVIEPKYLFLDESLSDLDEVLKYKLLHYIKRFAIDNKITIIFVTHNLEEAVYLSDRILLFSKLPAKIEKEYNSPYGKNISKEIHFEENFKNIIDDIRKDLYAKTTL